MAKLLQHMATPFNRGFTLVELIFVLAIIGVLALVAMPAYSALKDKVRMGRCMAEIRALEKDINAFAIDIGFLPNLLDDIGRANLRDPWERPYRYLIVANTPGDALMPLIGPAYNSGFDLYSRHKNGTSDKIFAFPATAPTMDDIVRTGNGGYVGLRV